MKNLKPLLLLGLVFVAGFCGGIVATRFVVRQFIREALRDPMVLQVKIEQRLVHELELSAEQQTKVHAILMDTGERIKVIRRDTHQQIAAILTPEQKEKFDRLHAARPRL